MPWNIPHLPVKGIRFYTRYLLGIPWPETCLKELMSPVLNDLIYDLRVSQLENFKYTGGDRSRTNTFLSKICHYCIPFCTSYYKSMLKISSRTSPAGTQKSTCTPAVILTSLLLSLKILLWEHLCEWRPSKGLYECLSLAVYLCMATYPATMHSSQADKSHVILSSKDATNIVDVKGYLHKLIDVLWTVPSSFPPILLANI